MKLPNAMDNDRNKHDDFFLKKGEKLVLYSYYIKNSTQDTL